VRALQMRLRLGRFGVDIGAHLLTWSSWGKLPAPYQEGLLQRRQLCLGAGISPDTRRILWTPDRRAGYAGMTPVDLVTPRERRCIIEEYDATRVILPRVRAAFDAYGKIVLNLLTLEVDVAEGRPYHATRS